MKKILFTIVAFVAFSNVGMAKTTDVLLIKENPCKSTFTWAFNSALSNGADADTAWAAASFMYDMCQAGVDWSLYLP